MVIVVVGLPFEARIAAGEGMHVISRGVTCDVVAARAALRRARQALG